MEPKVQIMRLLARKRELSAPRRSPLPREDQLLTKVCVLKSLVKKPRRLERAAPSTQRKMTLTSSLKMKLQESKNLIEVSIVNQPYYEYDN